METMNVEAPSVPAKLREWLNLAVESGASDLHLIVGYPPVLRLHGDLTELPEVWLTATETDASLRPICTAEAFERLLTRKNIDFSFELALSGGTNRFRANLFLTGGNLGACFRVVPSFIPDFAWTGFPAELAQRLAFVRDGMVIVTGATGSGKTTTLAMIVNVLNQAGGYRIITVEEPIEYAFPKAADSVVSQREVGTDVLTFADGLKYGLRQDPDAILVGEIRDRETAQMALSAAETGHLVFTSLHTRDVKGAITPVRRPVSPGRAERDSCAAGDEPAGHRQPAAAQRLRTRGETPPGSRGVVEHLSHRQRHPLRQNGDHRQLPHHRPRRRHDQFRRIGPATFRRRQDFAESRGAECQ